MSEKKVQSWRVKRKQSDIEFEFIIVWSNGGERRGQSCVIPRGIYGPIGGIPFFFNSYWCIDNYLESDKNQWGCGDYEFILIGVGVNDEYQRGNFCVNPNIFRALMIIWSKGVEWWGHVCFRASDRYSLNGGITLNF